MSDALTNDKRNGRKHLHLPKLLANGAALTDVLERAS